MRAFKTALAGADGVIIATPEYNNGIPGVLGNAIDWGSRLPGRARVLPPPELLGARAHERFDGELRLTDENTRRVLDDLLRRFAGRIARERAAPG